MAEADGIARLEAQRQNAISILLVLAIAGAFLLRFGLSPSVLNVFVFYTTEGGSILEKFHWGTYAILLMLPVALVTRPILLETADIPRFRALLRFCVGTGALIVPMLALGRTAPAGYLVDTYLVAGAAGMLMYCINAASRRVVVMVVVYYVLASALLGIVEAVTETRINPYYYLEAVFRPTGLTDHPLSLGLLCATGIGCVAATDWKIWVRVAAILLLVVGVAASGARFATLLAGAQLLALLVLVPWPGLTPRSERRAKTVVLVLVVLGGAALVAVLVAGGMLSRFSSGVVDENFFARITIYRIFTLTSPADILFGTDIEGVLAIVNSELDLPFIESSPVVFIYQLGLPLALVFSWMIAALFIRLSRGTTLPLRLATITFFLAALSNNTLSTKTPLVAIMVVMIVGLGSMNRPTRRQAVEKA